MTAPKLATSPVRDILAMLDSLTPGKRRILTGVTWEEYDELVNSYQDQASFRVSFIEGTLEVMPTGMPHDKYKEFILRLASALAEELEIDLETIGSTTLKRDKRRVGAEPDTSFYVQHATQMFGARKLDLEQDPPPDIVVEVDITHPSYSKRPIYARLGVPEIWRFDGKKFEINELVKGEYRARGTSVAFPFLQASDLLAFINQSLTDGQTKTLRDFRVWVSAHKPAPATN